MIRPRCSAPGFRLPGRTSPAPNGPDSRFPNGFELLGEVSWRPTLNWICSTGIPPIPGLSAAVLPSPSRCSSTPANTFRSRRRTTAPGRQSSNNGGSQCVRGSCLGSSRNRASYLQIRSSVRRKTGLPHPPAASLGFPRPPERNRLPGSQSAGLSSSGSPWGQW